MTDTTRVRIAVATELTAAYVARNAIAAADLPSLIVSLGAAIDSLMQGSRATPEVGGDDVKPVAPRPSAIRQSITPDALISFVDGRPYKTLKRHLGTHGFTPESYRARFGLPADYPMVAPSYSERRSAIAHGLGLGTMPGRRRAARV